MIFFQVKHYTILNSSAPCTVWHVLSMHHTFFISESKIRTKVCYILVSVFRNSSSVEYMYILCQILATIPPGPLSLYALSFLSYRRVLFDQQYQFFLEIRVRTYGMKSCRCVQFSWSFVYEWQANELMRVAVISLSNNREGRLYNWRIKYLCVGIIQHVGFHNHTSWQGAGVGQWRHMAHGSC